MMSSPVGTWSRTRLGFSLIELLVVISIIAVLASMLMVAIGLVRNGANSAVCLHQLRQMSIGAQVYAGDNEGYLPQVNFSFWDKSSAPLLVAAEYLTVAQGQINSGKNVMVCPADKRPDGNPYNNTWGGYSSKSCMSGSSQTTQDIQSSYCYNVSTFSVRGEFWETLDGRISPGNIANIPLTRAMFWDAPNLRNDTKTGNFTGLNFHRTGVNMAFLDGSARWYSFSPARPGEIWMYGGSSMGLNEVQDWWGENRRALGPGAGCPWFDNLITGRGEPWN